MSILPRETLLQRPKQAYVRIPLLVAAHLVACTAPLLMPLVPLEEAYVPLMWALSVPTVGAMMSLSAWIGLGGSRFVVRLLGACGGIAYLAIWLAVINTVQSRRAFSPGDLLGSYLTALGMYMGFLTPLAGIFLVARRWWNVKRIYDVGAFPPRDWRQFSMLNILVLMSAAAIVLTFVKISRSAPHASLGTWEWAVTSVVGIGILFANIWLGVRASLGPPPLARRLISAVVVAMLLGVAIAFTLGNDVHSAWVFACSCMMIPFATLIVIASTLVVRSCGYRLVPRTRGGNMQPEAA